ncbi:hypothetical protein SAWG_01361 [Staphylococcus aureus subsp. aureus M899]|nr:hypothetical protein SAWG_01361 [Staphylococcus aureus subsp. aureus M899]
MHIIVSWRKVSFCVGAPPQLAHYCKLAESQLLCWGPTPTCTLL